MTETASMTTTGEPIERSLQSATTDAESFDFAAVHEQVTALLGKQIFFVGGAEKSGTSWLQRLLDLHPQVSCSGESHFRDSLYPALKRALEDHNKLVLDTRMNAFLRELGEAPPTFDLGDLRYVLASAILVSLLKQERRKPAFAVGERTPRNVRAFRLLARLFPRAKCIHMVRDPRDAGISGWHMVRRFLPPEKQIRMVSKSDFVKQYAELWTQEVGESETFAARNPARHLDLRYEDLVEQSAPTLARVFRFLGVDDGQEILWRCIGQASFERLSGGRAPGQEREESFFRKGIVGDWKNHLDAETNATVIAKAGALMKRFGYL